MGIQNFSAKCVTYHALLAHQEILVAVYLVMKGILSMKISVLKNVQKIFIKKIKFVKFVTKVV